MKLEADLIFKIHVNCEKSIPVGNMNVIPIVGGTVEGKIKGVVVPGGADWNTRVDENTSHVFAKYLIKAENGINIAIENEGYISDDHSEIKTVPRFKVDSNCEFSWLNSGVYVGALEAGKEEGQVEIIIYKMS